MHPVERCAHLCAAPAWRLAYAMLRDADHAYDAVQQAFLVAARKPESIPAGDPWPWFAVVVAHEAQNLRRKRRPVPVGTGSAPEAPGMDVPDPRAPDPGRAVEAADEARAVWEAVGALPEAEREAVVLTHLAGLSPGDAAKAMDVPRQTVAERAQRGIETLAHRLRSSAPATAKGLALLPVAAPPRGIEAAQAAWVKLAMASVAKGAVIPGGAIVATTKTAWIVGLVLAAGLGFVGGGTTDGLGLFGASDAGDVARAAGHPPRDATVGAAPRPTGESGLAAGGEGAAASSRRLREENARLLARVADLEGQVAAVAPATGTPRRALGPTFTFGEMGRLDAVKEADWPSLSASAKVVGDAVAEIYRRTQAGEEVPRAVYLRLQENVERMRTYEYRTIDRMPTSAQHNGELTHPISAANLLAGILAQEGKPLTPAQVAEFERLGLAFEEEFARVRGAYGPDVPRARRLLDELRLKGKFMDGLWAVLTDEQRPFWIDPALKGIAGVDLFDPTLLVFHTTTVVTGATAADLRPKLVGLLRPKVGLAEGASDPRVDAAVDAWLARASRGVEPVARSAARNYTFAQAVVAGEATAELVEALLRGMDLSADAKRALRDDPTWYVARLLIP